MPITLFDNGTVRLTTGDLATGVHLIDQDGNTLTIGGAGGTSSTDDGAFTPGASSGTPAGGVVTSDSVDDGDFGVFAMLANRQQKVTLFDSSGNEMAVGGGTQYTQDAAAAANPVGTALNLIRADTLSGVTTTDGDNVAARGTDQGELYVKHVDSVAVTNAGLTALNGAIDGAEVQVDVVSSALPSGASTAAKQPALGTAGTASADVISVQGIASMTPLLVNGSGVTQPVSGPLTDTELRATAVPVSLASVPTTAITHAALTELGTALVDEDTAHASGDKGLAVWGVRQSSQADFGADGDYVPFSVNDDGELRVTMAAGTGGTAQTDGADFTAGSTGLTPIGGYRDDTSPGTVAEGKAAAARVTEYRAIHVNLRDAAGDEVVPGGGTQYDRDTAEGADDKLTMAGVVRKDTAASLVGTDGDRSALIVDASGRLHANVGASALPTGAATSAKQDTVIGHLDGVETLLGTIDADTGAIKTATEATQAAVEGTLAVAGTVDLGATDNAVLDAIAASLAILDNAISGNEMQVDVLTIAAGDNNIGNVDVVSLPALAAGTNNIGDVDVLTLPALPAGTNAIGKLAANSGVDIGDVDVTSISAGTNAIGNVGLIGRTTGGLSSYTAISTAAVLTAEIKGSAGQVFDIECFNVSTAPIYVRIYNQTGAPGTGDAANIIWRGMIPANADADAAGFVRISAIGRACSAGIGIRASGAVADNDATALTANVAFFNVGYS